MSSSLPPLRDVVSRYGLMAKKSLGQHFLLDQNITDKIVRLAGDLRGKQVIEVGPGPGGLTRSLLMSDAAHVWAIERDDRAVRALEELKRSYPDRLTLIAEDAMQVDVAALCPAPRVIIANLPYNIGTALLMGWLDTLHAQGASGIESLTLMFQTEVADRLSATPSSKAYGRLAIITQWLCDVHPRMHLPPSVFTPPPKVHSSVVTLIPKANPFPADKKTLELLTQMAFGQRRKMLRASLRSIAGIESLLEQIGVKPTQRAEEVSAEQFCKLAQLLGKA